jgi:hypothetical protein
LILGKGKRQVAEQKKYFPNKYLMPDLHMKYKKYFTTQEGNHTEQ